MLGCRICPATSASYRNRAVNCFVARVLGLEGLEGDLLLASSFRAAMTQANPRHR